MTPKNKRAGDSPSGRKYNSSQAFQQPSFPSFNRGESFAAKDEDTQVLLHRRQQVSNVDHDVQVSYKDGQICVKIDSDTQSEKKLWVPVEGT